MIGTTVSHYTILEKLGEGGMGVVYKARDTRLDRFVALKFLSSDLTSDESLRSRFIDEARAASMLDHPNIAVVHEIGELEDGRSFICMAYYEGETLRKRIDRGPLDIGAAIRIAVQICDGLQSAHEAGIVHRDIKPANIIITPDGTVDGTVKIVDFGLAKLTGQVSASNSGRLVGTTAYMSPEQIQGNSVDHRSDLFSLGIVLYEMLTGKRPFTGEHEAALLYAIVHDEPLPPSSVRSEIPAELERITMQLLRKDPAKRFQSAGSARDALNAAAAGGKFSPPSAVRYFARPDRRRYVLPLAGIIILTLSIAILTSRSSISLNPTDIVMVADVENSTSDHVFDHSLKEAIIVSLRQSAHLNLLPPERIMSALERMRIPGGRNLTDSTALSVARREGARVMIAAGISMVGSAYVISSKVVDVADGNVVKLSRRQVSRIEDVMGEIDGVCKDIRNLLGESFSEISANALPLERVTTPSLQALELHSRSMQLQRRGEYQEAAYLEEAAIHEDSLFAMAVTELSYIYRKLGNDSLSLRYHRRSHALMDRVTERERLYMSAIYYGPSFELDLPKAYENAHQLVVRYPNDAEGYSLLGWLAMYDGNAQRAIDAFQRSLSLDSITYAASVFNNWGYALAVSGEGVRARDYYRRSRQLRPAYAPTDGYIAQSYWMTGILDSAEAEERDAIRVSEGHEKLSRYAELASMYEFQGALPAAQRVCNEAIGEAQRMKLPADEAYFHYLLGELAGERADWKAYTSEMKMAELLAASPWFELPLIGSSYARRGRTEDCQRILSSISSVTSDDPFFLNRRNEYAALVSAELFLNKRSVGKASADFHKIERRYAGDPLYLLAKWGEARCDDIRSDTAAAALYAELLSRRSEVVMACIRNTRTSGFWVRQLWTDIDLALGKWFRARNDRTRAEEYIRRSLTFTGDADPRDLRAREAREILSQLTKAR